MKKLLLLLFVLTAIHVSAQEAFTINHYDVAITVNKDASINVDETINVNFTESRHGIIRLIPYKYSLQSLPAGTEKANRQLESGGYAHTIIDNIKVDGWDYEVSTDGDYKSIKIGSADNLVYGAQQYKIHYRILNAINFFNDHSELYFNIIGDGWNTTIDTVNFSVTLYDGLPDVSNYFVATGPNGSKENNTVTNWTHNRIFSGYTTQMLNEHEGVTIGIAMPKDFLEQHDYNLLGIQWLVLPLIAFISMLFFWRRFGKDEKPVVQTEYYPPENVSPTVSGYVIDNKLDKRDLTALVPYWGAGGYLQIKESESKALFGLVKNNEYTFIKLKDLPANAMQFEKTLFDGIFATGNNVELKDLKDVLYKTMSKSSEQLRSQIKKDDYYVKGSSTLGCLFGLLGIGFLIYGVGVLFGAWLGYIWFGLSLFITGIIILLFSFFMRKKTQKGTALYQKLLGFKEFIKSVEKDRLAEFLKQDALYFDKILPYAIVFGVADTWKDKLKGLDVPPPNWYVGNYNNFTTANFMNSLNHSMNQMSSTFYSAPSSSGSSGGSFGGGGSSGGGFGGGGGSSW